MSLKSGPKPLDDNYPLRCTVYFLLGGAFWLLTVVTNFQTMGLTEANRIGFWGLITIWLIIPFEGLLYLANKSKMGC